MTTQCRIIPQSIDNERPMQRIKPYAGTADIAWPQITSDFSQTLSIALCRRKPFTQLVPNLHSQRIGLSSKSAAQRNLEVRIFVSAHEVGCLARPACLHLKTISQRRASG